MLPNSCKSNGDIRRSGTLKGGLSCPQRLFKIQPLPSHAPDSERQGGPRACGPPQIDDKTFVAPQSERRDDSHQDYSNSPIVPLP